MATTKRSTKKSTDANSNPIVDRPLMPPDYGMPKDKKGLLPWSHITERMTIAKYYWVSSVSPDGRPHTTPVDGLWIDDLLYFGGSPKTKRHRNLAANPAACIHLDDGMDVVILHGEVSGLRADADLAMRLAKASKEKYGWGSPELYQKGEGVMVFRPRTVLAWKQFPKDATRWQFQDGD